jgi:hypothetical protein
MINYKEHRLNKMYLCKIGILDHNFLEKQDIYVYMATANASNQVTENIILMSTDYYINKASKENPLINILELNTKPIHERYGKAKFTCNQTNGHLTDYIKRYKQD